jgi:hypothetical protein
LFYFKFLIFFIDLNNFELLGKQLKNKITKIKNISSIFILFFSMFFFSNIKLENLYLFNSIDFLIFLEFLNIKKNFNTINITNLNKFINNFKNLIINY